MVSSSSNILLQENEDDLFGEDEEDDNVDMSPPESGSLPLEVPSSTCPSEPTCRHSFSSLFTMTSLPFTSPFPHHNSGPTCDRLRNAMHRISADPTWDSEAWQVLLTEAQSCYRMLLPHLHKMKNYPTLDNSLSSAGPDLELLGRKMDWIETCYGVLLQYFPYAGTHYVQLIELLMRFTALTVDEEEQCGGISIALGGVAAVLDSGLTTPDQGVAITPASLLMSPEMVRSSTERQELYEAKLDCLFQTCLGVTLDGAPAIHGEIQASDAINAESATLVDGAKTIIGGICKYSVDLWLLYIRKRSWNAARAAGVEIPLPLPPPGYTPNMAHVSVIHQQYEESLRLAYRERKEKIRNEICRAYETALEHGAGFVQNNHLFWKRYVNFTKSWTDTVNYTKAVMSVASWYSRGASLPIPPLPPIDPVYDHATSQKQLSHLRSIYQRGVTHPMTGLDQLWQEYELFERSHSESLASVLIAEWLPKYQHARSIYLERNRIWNAHELRVGRLAVPPVGYKHRWNDTVGMSTGSSSGVGALMGLSSRGGPASTKVVGVDDDFAGESSGAPGSSGGGTLSFDAEYTAQMEEERLVLSKWRRRVGYERTNPERLNSSEYASRVRASYCEEACAFTRHPEVWYEWSQWELLHGMSIAASVASTSAGSVAPTGSAYSATLMVPAIAGDWKSGGNAIRAIAVLTLGMESLPDSALLAQAQAEILERHIEIPSENNEKHVGSAKGCIQVLERLIRRSPTTLGFVLLQRLVQRHEGMNAARAIFSRARRTLLTREDDVTFVDEGKNKAPALLSTTERGDDFDIDRAKDESTADAGVGVTISQQRMVTNRLNYSVGSTKGINAQENKQIAISDGVNAGYITWHLYAAHATMEHRLSKKPLFAARIYELGLRKHRTFLSTPPYVLHYANLLLELNDEENLRSLLMRAVAACEEDDAIMYSVGGSDTVTLARRREVQRPLWDMMLKFESVFSSQMSNENVSANVAAVEARRRRALYGPGNEDVVVGREGPPDEEDLSIGVQKSSLNEQLIRSEGYDVASRIANGMARMVDVLTVTGAIGNGESGVSSLDFSAALSASLSAGGSSSNLWGDVCAGGTSDVSYVQRLQYQRDVRLRSSSSSLIGGLPTINQAISGSSGKLLSSRERSASVIQGINAVAIQNTPEWLRSLFLLLPPIPKFGRGLQKPPPHLIEMALSALRANTLPQRPVVENSTSNSNGVFSTVKKRGREDITGEDSSDEDDGDNGGGYSNQFRARQRARLIAAGSD